MERQQIRLAMAKLLSTLMQRHALSGSELARQLELPVSSVSDWLLCKSDMNDVAKSRLLTVYPEVGPQLLAVIKSGSSDWRPSTFGSSQLTKRNRIVSTRTETDYS